MVATDLGAYSSPALSAETTPRVLREAIRDLLFIKDRAAASRRLVEKLTSFSAGMVDMVTLDQGQLRLLQANGARHRHRLHPQGMEVDWETGLLYITAVEVIDERDKKSGYPGRGRAHLFECNVEGETIRSITLTSDNEAEYHPSGMVLVDGTMFIALAQYLPDTSATIIKFDVRKWTYEKLFCVQDHIGLVIPNPVNGELFLGTWGSRHYYHTDLNGSIKSKRATPCSDTMEHQDAQLIGASMGDHNNTLVEAPMILATGVTAGGMEYFGLEIVDVASWTIKTSLRWPSAQYMTKGGWAPFANPSFLWVDSRDRVLALATPDDDHEQLGKDATLVLYTLRMRE